MAVPEDFPLEVRGEEKKKTAKQSGACPQRRSVRAAGTLPIRYQIDMGLRDTKPRNNLLDQFVQVKHWTMSVDCGQHLVNDPRRKMRVHPVSVSR